MFEILDTNPILHNVASPTFCLKYLVHMNSLCNYLRWCTGRLPRSTKPYQSWPSSRLTQMVNAPLHASTHFFNSTFYTGIHGSSHFYFYDSCPVVNFHRFLPPHSLIPSFLCMERLPHSHRSSTAPFRLYYYQAHFNLDTHISLYHSRKPILLPLNVALMTTKGASLSETIT